MALAELNGNLECLTALPSDEPSRRRLAMQRRKLRQHATRLGPELDAPRPA